jgi:hypothetical protein
MGSSPGFGSAPRDSRPFGLAFAPAPPVPGLTSPRTATRRLILQKARRHPTRHRGEAPTGRKRTVSGALSLPLNGVLFTVPSRYWFPIGRCWYLALGRGRPRFPPAFTWRAVLTLRSHAADPSVTYGALTHLRRPVPAVFGCQDQPQARGGCRPLPIARPTPQEHRRQAVPPSWFGLRPVRSPLLGASSLFLGVLRCFSSPGALPRPKARVSGYHPTRVAPFGNLWIPGCQRLPRASRRVAASFLGQQHLGIHRALIFADLSSNPCTGPTASAPSRDQRPLLSSMRTVKTPSRWRSAIFLCSSFLLRLICVCAGNVRMTLP